MVLSLNYLVYHKYIHLLIQHILIKHLLHPGTWQYKDEQDKTL